MSGVIGSLKILSSVNTSGFSKGLKKIDSGLTSFSKSFKKIGAQVATAGAAISGVAFGVATAALTAWTKSSLEAIDATSKLSDRIGVSTEALVSWEYGAGLSGVAADKLKDGLKDLSVRLGQARQGSKTSADAFKALGVDINNVASTEDVFRQLATSISGISDPAQQASAAVSVFGESGYHLLNFLKQGESGLAAFEAEAEKLGITFSRVDGAQVEMANDAFARLQTVTTAIGNKLAIELAPIIQGIAESLLSASDQGFSFGDIVSTSIEWVIKGLGVLLDVVHTLKLGFAAAQAAIIKGFALSLDGVVMLANGLESLLNMIPGVSVSFGAALAEIQKGLHESANEAFSQVAQDFEAATPSERLNSWLDDVKSKSKQAAQSIADSAASVDDLGSSFAGASEDASKLIAKLTEQIATFGLSSTEAEIFKLAQQGVSDELLDQIRGLDGQLKALEDAKSKQDELSAAAQTVVDGLKTPLDNYKDEVANLKDLLDTGNLTQDQFDKALEQATSKLNTAADVTLSQPQLIQKGSQAEAAFLADWQNGVNDPIADVAMSQEETNAILRDILRALGLSGDKVEEVVAIA